MVVKKMKNDLELICDLPEFATSSIAPDEVRINNFQ